MIKTGCRNRSFSFRTTALHQTLYISLEKLGFMQEQSSVRRSGDCFVRDFVASDLGFWYRGSCCDIYAKPLNLPPVFSIAKRVF